MRFWQHSTILVPGLLFLFAPLPTYSKWVQKHVVPVRVEACGAEQKYPPEKLFDGRTGVDDKWCCFHAGYDTPQTHWVDVDLGQSYALIQCIVYHEGFRAGNQAHYNTEDFSISGSDASIDGPWTLISRVTDNLQPFNVIAGNNAKVRYLRMEVTDTEGLNNPRTPNTDYAVRILEWGITVWEYQPDAPGQQPTSTAPPVPEPAARGGSGSAPVTARPILYFFYTNEHQKSREFYSSVVLKRENWPIVTRFTVIPVDMNSERTKVQEMGVFRSPTCIIVTPEGRRVADLPGVQDERQFLQFLQANLR